MVQIPGMLLPKVEPTAGTLPRLTPWNSPETPERAFTKQGGPDLSAAAAGLDRIGAEQQRIHAEQTAKANQIAVLNADNQLSDLETHLLRDPDTGTLNQQGSNAFGEPGRVSAAWSDGVQKIRASLANEDQQAAFDNMALRRWGSINQQVQTHVGQQHIKYDNDVTTTALKNSQDAAAQNFDDASEVEFQIAKQRAILADAGKRLGLPDETVEFNQDRAESASRFSVLNEYLDRGMDQAASAYLTAHRESFIGKDLTDAEKLTGKASAKGAAIRASDQIMKSATSLDDGLKAAGTIDDPTLREETEKRVRQAFADHATSERQIRDQAYERATKIIQDNGGNTDAVPLSLREKISPTEWTDLERAGKSIRNPERITDLRTFTNLVNLSSLNDSTKQQFVNTDPATFKSKLSDADYKHIVELQRTVRNQMHGAETRADAASQKKEEAGVIADAKKGQASDAAQALVAGLVKDSATKAKLAQPKARVTVPQWMIDSAQKLPAYKSYLKAHGVDVDGQTAKVAQQAAPKSPGGPINLTPKNPPPEEE